MILQPAVLALLLIATIVAGMGLYAAYYGIIIIYKWDRQSGSEIQLELERRTYLISTILSYILCFELMSLFLLIYTADELHTLFTGAMCAAGTLAINNFGYPVLILKIVNFLLAGVWLILNHADNSGYDYPLIKVKYKFLTTIVPLLLLEGILMAAYFAGAKPDIITSCCGTLFSHESKSVSGEIASLPNIPMQITFFSSMAITIFAGLFFYIKGKCGYFFSIASALTFLISIISIISFISLYFYELPTHHCPFCLLQPEYAYIGYWLYAALFAGAVAGISVGVLMPFRSIKSLVVVIPSIQRRLTLLTIACYLVFVSITVWQIFSSALRVVRLDNCNNAKYTALTPHPAFSHLLPLGEGMTVNPSSSFLPPSP